MSTLSFRRKARPVTSDGYFDAKIAETYDQDHNGTDPALIAKTVECLVDLSGNGDMLEFAVGTERIALPLIAKGARVKGIEFSIPLCMALRDGPYGQNGWS